MKKLFKSFLKRYKISDFYFSFYGLAWYLVGIITTTKQHGFINSLILFSFLLLPILIIPSFSREERIKGNTNQ